MTDKDKQRIARLVAEKVWGWYYLPPQGNACADEYVLSQVFSWPGFGRTVERMEFKDMKYEYTMGWTRFYAPNKKPWGSEVKSEVGSMDTYVGFKDEIITACHLAALDALGIDWRTDND